MKGSELHQLLGQLEEAPAPEPSALFVAKLEADLRQMDQTPEAEAPTTSRRTRRARVFVAAAPVAALATAAAAAAVALLPSKPHAREVNTADPGVTAPAPPSETPSSLPTSTTVATPPWLPPSPSPSPTTTVVGHQPPATAPRSDVQPPPAVAPPPEPVSTTAPPAPTTTVPPFETPSLHCTAGVSGGTPGVSCTWSASTSPSFHWYRLYREVAGTNRVLVFSSDNRSVTTYADKTVQTGTTYAYRVEFTDAAGTVIGRSAATSVACC